MKKRLVLERTALEIADLYPTQHSLSFKSEQAIQGLYTTLQWRMGSVNERRKQSAVAQKRFLNRGENDGRDDIL